MPAPIQKRDEKQKIVKYYNTYGGYVIETTYNPNTNSYNTRRLPFNIPPKLN
jgi:hypothetical protein